MRSLYKHSKQIRYLRGSVTLNHLRPVLPGHTTIPPTFLKSWTSRLYRIHSLNIWFFSSFFYKAHRSILIDTLEQEFTRQCQGQQCPDTTKALNPSKLHWKPGLVFTIFYSPCFNSWFKRLKCGSMNFLSGQGHLFISASLYIQLFTFFLWYFLFLCCKHNLQALHSKSVSWQGRDDSSDVSSSCDKWPKKLLK